MVTIANIAQQLDQKNSVRDIRPEIPKLGLRDYWHPGILAKKVGWRKPVKVKMLGEDICFFRAKDGRVVAISDVCPHRGASMGEGDCHWKGTVSCPYHGWVYDEHGKNIAVLSEGPDAKVCGKPGTEVKVYSTQEIRGLVFVWMGEGTPAPIEEDVPEEMFDPDVLVVIGENYWPINWEVALENSMDSHVNYVHRNAVMILRLPFLPRGARGDRPVFTGNGFTADMRYSKLIKPQPYQDEYPELGIKWPKHKYRLAWAWVWKLILRKTDSEPFSNDPRWANGHHLPGLYRSELSPPKLVYNRVTVPVTENLTRLWYYIGFKPMSKATRTYLRPLWELYRKIDWALWRRWLIVQNFSTQDARVMIPQRYDTPEKLSGTDAEIVAWRELVVAKAKGGRNAPFHYPRTMADLQDASTVDLGKLVSRTEKGYQATSATGGSYEGR